jgi:hypothetical protein
MKERIQPNGLIIQLNDPNDVTVDPTYLKAFSASQFKENMELVESMMIRRPVAIWKIKYDANNYFKNTTIKG